MLKLRCSVATIVALLFLTSAAVLAEQNADEEQTTAESLVPVTEPPVKLVHVLNPGEREYLSPNLIGVQNIAMTFLPLTMNFINVIDAYREIVNGVRYDILLNANDTKNKDIEVICHLVILEKPWLRTEWGDKVRELVTSNCTSDADNLTDPAATGSKIISNPIFNGGNRNELSDNEMKKLESQIMPVITTTTTTTTTTEKGPNEDDNATDQNTDELNDKQKKLLDDIFALGAQQFEKSLQSEKNQNGGGSGETESTATIVKNDDNSESNYLLQIATMEQQQPTAQNQAEIEHEREQQQHKREQHAYFNNEFYPVEGEDKKQQQEQNHHHQQQQEQEQQQQRDEQQAELPQVSVKDEHHQYHEETNEQTPATAQEQEQFDQNIFVGGPSSIDNNDAEERLQKSLTQLAAGNGPTYSIRKIHSATTQIVAGTRTVIDAELIDSNGAIVRCTVDIWSRPWLRGNDEVSVDCPESVGKSKRVRRSVEWAEKKTHKKHNHHNLNKVEHLFSKFQVKYNRRYHTTAERQMRLRIFRQNLQLIEELNRKEQGSAKYGITEFADMTTDEYKQRTGLWQREEGAPSPNAPAVIPNIELPKEFDWRAKGAVSIVKNQGSCGSCWAFSVVGNIEGLHAVKNGNLEEYSEQELLDCDTIDSACQGGFMDNAYKALEKIGGLELESEYPYKAKKQECHFNKTLVHVRVKGGVDLPKNETAMAQWLITNGPISIGINANAMQFYRGGVSHPWHPLCSRKNLDHGVLIVGYGVSDYPMFKKTLPYWIVKNSWGPKWGEQGYYRVYRGDNTCGVSEMATSAVLEN